MRDYHETIQWLREYGECKRHEQELEEELSEWQSKAEGLSSKLSGMPSGTGDGDALPRAVEKIVELQEQINRLIESLADMCHEREVAIDSLPREMWMLVLRYRYLLCLTWEQVCGRMHYSWKHVHRLHKDAIAYLSEKMT